MDVFEYGVIFLFLGTALTVYGIWMPRKRPNLFPRALQDLEQHFLQRDVQAYLKANLPQDNRQGK